MMPTAKRACAAIPKAALAATCAVRAGLRYNPLDLPLSSIRLWGVLVDYKPKRQRRWSRALVPHGADARSAIAAVLGVRAEQIGVREPAEH